MLRRAILACVMTIGIASAAWAADPTGKWVGSVDTPNGPIELTFDLKAEGDVLSGSVSSAMGTQAISNGKVADDVLTFDVDLDGGKITHEAKVNAAGDEIAIKATGDFGTIEYVVKKSAPAK